MMDTINGTLWKEMLENGANLLANKVHEIDALNVFPVPDGDTGTNMSLTFSNGVNDALRSVSSDIGEIAKVLSKGLLMGARGNSGVITSQIFRGFYQGVEDMSEINGHQLANAFVQGSRVAYKAVMRPVEGTILTVIREAADYTFAYAKEKQSVSVLEVMEKMVFEANESLKRTPDLLPVLKEVGVVDSGGAGLLSILEGFLAALKGEKIKKEDGENKSEVAGAMLESDEFGYCTEFIIRLSKQGQRIFKEQSLRDALERIGNSIVCVQDEDIVKVHVHTLIPGDALNLGQRYGEFVKLKVENMQEQHAHILSDGGEDGAKEEFKKFALIAVAPGSGLKRMFEELRVDHVISGGQTMNPSTEDFVEVIEHIHAKHIFILPNNSNIILAAQQAASVCEDKEVRVIESKSIPQGLSACMNFNPDVACEENTQNMNEAIQGVKTGLVTYAIKDTTFEGMKIKAGDYMGINEKMIRISCKDKMEAAQNLMDQMIDKDCEVVMLIYGEDVQKTEADVLKGYIEKKYDVEVEVEAGGQPVYSFIFGIE